MSEIYVESPIDAIVDVHFGDKTPPPDGGGPGPGEGGGTIQWSFFTGGISSDGLAVGSYLGPEFNGTQTTISGSIFADVFGSGSINFEMHFELVEAGDEITLGPVVATSASQNINGSVDDDHNPFGGTVDIILTHTVASGDNNLLRVRAVVTDSEVTGKDIMLGVWLGGAHSGWNTTITFSN